MAGTSQESRLAIVIDTAGAERRIRDLRRQLRDLGGAADDTTNNSDRLNNANRRLSQSTSKLSKVMGLAAKAMKYGGAAIFGVGVAAVKVSGDFEEAMNGVRAVSGAVGEDFNQMRELAKKMGSETAFSATEAANGMEFLAMAGMNTEQIMSTIPNALSLAAAGSIELAQSADILSNVMSGMGIAAEDSARVADVLAQSAASANVSIDSLGETMKYVAPISKQLGYSLEQTAAMSGILGNAGISGGQAGTMLKTIATNLAASSAAQKGLDQLGVSAKDLEGNVRPIPDILYDMKKSMDGMGSAEKLAFGKAAAGQEALTGLLVLMDSVEDGTLSSLEKDLEDAEGAAQRMADIRMEGFNGAIKGAKSAAEGFLIAIGDSGLLDLAAGAVTGLADGIRALTEWLPTATADITAFFQSAEVATAAEMAMSALKTAWDNLVSVVRAAGDAIAPVIDFFREHDKLSEALAISIGLVAGAFVVYNAAVAIGTAVTGGFVAVLALLTSPITLTIAALVALTAAGVYLYQNWDEIKAKAIEIWDSIKGYISTAVETMKAAFSRWVDNTKGAIINIKNAVIDTLKELPSKLLQIGKDIIQGLIDGIKGKAQAAVDAIKNTASNMYQGVKNFFVIRSPSRLMRQLGVHTIDGLILGIKDKESDAYRAAVSVAQSLLSGIESTQKEIALFGNNSSLASLLYDIENTDKYKDVSKQLIQQLVDETKALEQMNARAKAALAIQERFDKMNKDRERRRNEAGAGLAGVKSDLLGAAGNPVSRIVSDYERQMSAIREFEQTHQDILKESADKQIEIERMKNMALQDMMLASGEIIAGDMASIFRDMLGEKSSVYRAMFAIEKGFAITQAAIAIQRNVAAAMAVGFPQNVPFIAGAVSQGASLMSNIKGITAGFKQGGYTGNMGASQVAGVVHGQEYVFDAQSTKRIGVDNLNAMRSGKAANDDSKVSINIVNNSSARVTASDDGQTITIEDVRNENKRSWTNLSNPNSFESKQVNRNVQAPRRR